jgi:preprotein translocase subunit YajC
MARPVAVHTYRGGGNAARVTDQAVKTTPLRAWTSVAIGPLPGIVRANRRSSGNGKTLVPSDTYPRGISMFVTPAYAQASPLGDSLLSSPLMVMIPIIALMYFLILRPQQKRMKEHQDLVKNLRRGDTVVTSGGLVGKVTKVVDEEQIEVEIADGVRVRQVRSMISGVRAKGEPVKDDSSKG